MNVVIVLPALTLDQLDTIAEDILEAHAYMMRTGYETRVTVAGFDREGRPIYTPIPADELTAVEERELQVIAGAVTERIAWVNSGRQTVRKVETIG